MNRSQMYAFMCAELTNGSDDVGFGPTAGCALCPEASLPEGDDWVHLPELTKQADGSTVYHFCSLGDTPEGLSDTGCVERDGVLYVGGSSWAMFHFRFKRG